MKPMELQRTPQAASMSQDTWGGLDGNSNAYNGDLFVVKYNSLGTKQWTKQLGTNDYDNASGVATDSSGNVYVVGGTGVDWTEIRAQEVGTSSS